MWKFPVNAPFTVYRVMEEIGISHHPRRKPNGITKADREARKSDDLLKRDFHAEEPLTKCVTDLTKIKGKDGKLYVSAIFDCFDSSVIGLAMDTNRKAPLCVQTLENAAKAYPGIHKAIIHSDRGSQYTNIPASFTGKRFGSMTYSKAWTAQEADATIMLAVRACGPEWNQNYCMTVMP